MVDPTQLTNAIVAKLQSIAGILSEVGDDPTRIYPYRRFYKRAMVLADAVWQMPEPSMMVLWEGVVTGNIGKMEVLKHQFGIYIRPKEHVQADASCSAYLIWHNFTDGVPTAGIQLPSTNTVPGYLVAPDGMQMLLTVIHPACYPIERPSMLPQMGSTEESKGPFEYWKISFSLCEAAGNWQQNEPI
jgi:hypothetical protein